MSIESVMPSNCLIFCHPLLLLPSIFPSIRVFISQSALRIRWPKYWTPNYWSFSISPSNEYSELISFRIDWFDLLAVQGTLKSLLQNHNSKASILCLSFFMVQLSHLYMTTGKILPFTLRLLLAKWCLCFLICCFLSRSKHLLISVLQLPSAVTLEPKKKNLSLFPLFPHLFVMKWWDWMPWS